MQLLASTSSKGSLVFSPRSITVADQGGGSVEFGTPDVQGNAARCVLFRYEFGTEDIEEELDASCEQDLKIVLKTRGGHHLALPLQDVHP